MDINIDKKELLELASAKLAQMHYEEEQDYQWIATRVDNEIQDVIHSRVNKAIDDALNDLLPKILTDKITPVNVWGETAGKPGTIKDILQDKALSFWNQKVDNRGLPCTYGNAKTRAQRLVQQEAAQAFEDAMHEEMKNHFEGIVKQLKESLRENAIKDVDSMLQKLIKIK
jgi:hypothetical protein